MEILSIQEVANYVEMEGLGYAVMSGLSARNIKDPELARQWRIAEKVLMAIQDILEREQ